MRVLVVNAGSSSLKLRLLGSDDGLERAADLPGGPDGLSAPALAAALSGWPAPDVVGHRVVHGGRTFLGPVLVDQGVRRQLGELTDLAPLHQPGSLAALDALSGQLPGVPAVACFDTAFHSTMPAAATTYAVPRQWRERYGVRRYGFHGLSHAYASRHGAQLVGRHAKDLRIVTCHLGSGASLCAVDHGISVDTTMGFTPTEGLVMGTRSGSVDPGMLTWLMEPGRLSVEELTDGLVRTSGLAGLSGTSGDARDVSAALAAGSAQAQLAFDVWSHRLRREIAGMVAAMDGLDLLVVTGGVGEHAEDMREQGLQGLEHLGVHLDLARNLALKGEGEIGAAGSTVPIVVVVAREDVEMARQARAALTR